MRRGKYGYVVHEACKTGGMVMGSMGMASSSLHSMQIIIMIIISMHEICLP